MKKEKNIPTENLEEKPPSKQSKTKVAKNKALIKKKQSDGVRLPFLLELAYTLSTIILILLALTTMITSLLAGASLFMIIIRTGVAVTVVGSLLMLISSQISSGLLFSVKIEREEEQRKQEESLSVSKEERHEAEA